MCYRPAIISLLAVCLFARFGSLNAQQPKAWGIIWSITWHNSIDFQDKKTLVYYDYEQDGLAPTFSGYYIDADGIQHSLNSPAAGIAVRIPLIPGDYAFSADVSAGAGSGAGLFVLNSSAAILPSFTFSGGTNVVIGTASGSVYLAGENPRLTPSYSFSSTVGNEQGYIFSCTDEEASARVFCEALGSRYTVPARFVGDAVATVSSATESISVLAEIWVSWVVFDPPAPDEPTAYFTFPPPSFAASDAPNGDETLPYPPTVSVVTSNSVLAVYVFSNAVSGSWYGPPISSGRLDTDTRCKSSAPRLFRLSPYLTVGVIR